MSTIHSRKRPYQPSIAAYFNNRNADPRIASTQQRVISPLSPPLLPDTQASLLSVGMRVRKSVPEGYKTHKTIGTEGFPFPSTAPPRSTAPTRSSYVSSTRELTPFCGLHKTGGWAAQDVPSSSAPAVLRGNDDDEYTVPGMSMSQGTLSSTQGSLMSSVSGQQLSSSRKRTYEDEIEEDLDAIFSDEEVTVMEATDVIRAHIDRPMARLKPSLRKAATTGMVRIVGEDDFAEASFLVPSDGMEVEIT